MADASGKYISRPCSQRPLSCVCSCTCEANYYCDTTEIDGGRKKCIDVGGNL